LAESDIATLVIIPRSTKFDILRFIEISEPELRSFVEAVDNMLNINQKGGVLEVI